MNTRDQAEAGGDATKTVQLDDTYRVRVLCGSSEIGNGEQAARLRPRVPFSATESLPLDDQLRQAESALNSALTEFRIATSAVIDRIKAGENLPKPELDREWNARIQVLRARKLVERLDSRRKAFAPEKRCD